MEGIRGGKNEQFRVLHGDSIRISWKKWGRKSVRWRKKGEHDKKNK